MASRGQGEAAYLDLDSSTQKVMDMAGSGLPNRCLATFAAVLVAAGAGSSATASAPPTSRPTSTADQVVVIARSHLAATNVSLTVRRTSRFEGAMRVHMRVLSDGEWTSAGSLKVGNVFWFVATGVGGLCRFSVGESANSGQDSPPVVTTRPVAVRPLLGPALGCGKTYHFHFNGRHLVRGR
jgi:hypothetical protein